MTAMDSDSSWDYSRPDETERRFREALAELSHDDLFSLELLTQIARAQGLQRKFDDAHNTLDIVERKLNNEASRAKVRYLLERGAPLILLGGPIRCVLGLNRRKRWRPASRRTFMQ